MNSLLRTGSFRTDEIFVDIVGLRIRHALSNASFRRVNQRGRRNGR